jgi:putative salt-induced outer membrane protein
MKRTFLTINSCVLGLAVTATCGQAAATTSTVPNLLPTQTPWDLSVAAGLTLTRGNSKTLLTTANFTGVKKWDQNELDLGVDGVYGKNDGVKSAESLDAYGQYNRLFSERFFGYARVEGLHDAIADINYRITASPGVGYYFIKDAATSLRGEVGPGYLYERDSDGSSDSYVTLRLADRFDHKFNDRVKIWQSAELLPQVDKFSNYILNAEIGVESAMSKHLSLQTILRDSYHSEPAAGRVKNDVMLIAGVKYKF